MLFRNNTIEAVMACERARTGNYGADEYKNCDENFQDSSENFPLPEGFRFYNIQIHKKG